MRFLPALILILTLFATNAWAICDNQARSIKLFIGFDAPLAGCEVDLFYRSGQLAFSRVRGEWYHQNGRLAQSYLTGDWHYANGRLAFEKMTGDWFYLDGRYAFERKSGNWFFPDGNVAYAAIYGDWYHPNGRLAYKRMTGELFYPDGRLLGRPNWVSTLEIVEFIENRYCDLEFSVFCALARILNSGGF